MADPVLKNQIITLSAPPATLTVGQQFTVTVAYNVSDANKTLGGVGFEIHFDSTKLELVGTIAPSFTTSLFGSPSVNPEAVSDNNATTDKQINWQYLDFGASWPGVAQTLPLTLGTVTFKALVASSSAPVLNTTIATPSTGYTGPNSLAIAPAIGVQNEGNAGSTPFTFTVTRSGDTSATTTAQFDVIGSGTNPANAADFGGTFPTGTVNFAAGETTKTITINVSGDTTVEPDEGFTVTLGNPTNATTTNSTFTTTTATGTIIDDDTPTVSLAVSPASVAEDGTPNLVYTFTRTGATTNPLTVNFNVGGTATLANDYSQTGAATFTASTGTVTFAAGSATATVTIDPTADTIFEPDETVALTLAPSADYKIAPTTAVTGTIANDDAPPVFSIASASATEGGAITFTVTRTGNAQETQAVTVTPSIGGSDTASNSDFTANTQTLSFAQGETSKTFTVQTTQDTLFEGNETFTATLSNATNGAIIDATKTTATGAITNDDAPPVFTFASSSVNATEGGAITFTVIRTGDAQATQTVTVATSIAVGDTASTTDFTTNTQTLSFAQGETSKTFTVQTTQDTLFEGNETFTATLSNATNGAIIDQTINRAIGTITNDDAAPVFAIAPASATEGGAITFTVTRTGDAQATQSVTVATSLATGDTASATDFSATPTPTSLLSFATGETSKTFTVQTTQDTILEADETFTATLSNPTNGATLSTTNGKATGTIKDDDTPRITLAISPASVAEDGTPNLVYTFTRTGITTSPLTVNYSVGGTATLATDYSQAGAATFTASTGTVTFAANATTATVTIDPTSDAIFESDETVALTLAASTNYIIDTPATVTGTITNDDPAPVFAIASASATEGGAITFTVTRTGNAQETQSVTFATSIATGNTASAADFIPNTGTLSFAQGETSKTFTVQTTQDTLFEGNETFTATLSAPTNGATLDATKTTVTGTINNDDAAPVFAIASASANEGGTITFTVTRTGDAQATQAVTFATSIATGNTASATDFTTNTGSLSFATGETSKTFTVQTTQDTLFEGDETFTVTISAPTNGATIDPTKSTATGTIKDDDPAPIFAIASAAAIEGGLINFTVTRTGDAQATQAVTVATSIGTSNTASTNDFTAKTETLSFATGETTKTFSVQTTQDTLFEADETFTAALSNATNGATLSTSKGSATGTITNDDAGKATISKVSDDIFNLTGASTSKLKVSFTDAGSSSINELGVFSVDDATGKIGSFAVGSAGYAQAALQSSKIIFSAIANKPTGFTPNSSSLIETTGNLRFYLIKSDTTTEEALKSSNFSNVLFSSNSAKITDSGSGSFAIAWEDGSGNNSFKSLAIKVEGSDESVIGTKQQGNFFSGKGGGEVIDLLFASGLTSDTKSVTADFTVNREAAFNNFVGFYKVADTNGGIDTNSDGIADITPGQNGYIQAAIKGRVAGIDLAVSNQGTAQITGKTFEVNSIFAPFIIVNGTTDALLDSNTSNDPAVYFSYLGANTDGVDHIRVLGNNTFGFEDLPNGGDRDFNDVIIKATLTAVK